MEMDKVSQITKTQTTKAPAPATKDSGRVKIGGSSLNF